MSKPEHTEKFSSLDELGRRLLARDREKARSQIPVEALGPRGRNRSRVLRADISRLLQQADSGSVCLCENAEEILDLATELVEVENGLDSLMIMGVLS